MLLRIEIRNHDTVLLVDRPQLLRCSKRRYIHFGTAVKYPSMPMAF